MMGTPSLYNRLRRGAGCASLALSLGVVASPMPARAAIVWIFDPWLTSLESSTAGFIWGIAGLFEMLPGAIPVGPIPILFQRGFAGIMESDRIHMTALSSMADAINVDRYQRARETTAKDVTLQLTPPLTDASCVMSSMARTRLEADANANALGAGAGQVLTRYRSGDPKIRSGSSLLAAMVSRFASFGVQGYVQSNLAGSKNNSRKAYMDMDVVTSVLSKPVLDTLDKQTAASAAMINLTVGEPIDNVRGGLFLRDAAIQYGLAERTKIATLGAESEPIISAVKTRMPILADSPYAERGKDILRSAGWAEDQIPQRMSQAMIEDIIFKIMPGTPQWGQKVSTFLPNQSLRYNAQMRGHGLGLLYDTNEKLQEMALAESGSLATRISEDLRPAPRGETPLGGEPIEWKERRSLLNIIAEGVDEEQAKYYLGLLLFDDALMNLWLNGYEYGWNPQGSVCRNKDGSVTTTVTNNGQSVTVTQHPDGTVTDASGKRIDGPFLLSPVNGAMVSSPWGACRTSNAGACGRTHKGEDFPAPAGTPVLAVGDGRVTRVTNTDSYVCNSNNTSTALGCAVWVEHTLPNGQRVETVYGHVQCGSAGSGVGVGGTVTRGQQIGQVGHTGNARCGAAFDHVHFAVWQNGAPVPPTSTLSGYNSQFAGQGTPVPPASPDNIPMCAGQAP